MHDTSSSNEYRGKKIAILGFGVESQETVEFLLKQGALLHVLDQKDEKNFNAERLLYLRNEGVNFSFGRFQSLADFDIIIRSPGIRPGIHALHEAGDLGIEITSATNIFLKAATGTVIGVTGTKGKGTTAALLFEIISNSGRDVYLGGNIGVPALSFLNKLRKESISVLELSSFQLIDATVSPQIAVVLMVTQDHLDYHADVKEYIAAKFGITKFQGKEDAVIVNVDYPGSVAIADQSQGRKLSASKSKELTKGCFVHEDQIVIAKDGDNKKIIAINDILLPGKHNLENVCAAVMAADLIGVSHDHIAETLKTFKGLQHRLELVREVSGIHYYNDSISTMPDSAIAAIFAFEEPKVLILGGSSKANNFTELGKIISESGSIKAIIGIGKEWPEIKSHITKQMKFIENCNTMEDIVAKASAIAESGDVVILSPACASFDMFKDYKDRGDQFKVAVNKL